MAYSRTAHPLEGTSSPALVPTVPITMPAARPATPTSALVRLLMLCPSTAARAVSGTLLADFRSPKTESRVADRAQRRRQPQQQLVGGGLADRGAHALRERPDRQPDVLGPGGQLL